MMKKKTVKVAPDYLNSQIFFEELWTERHWSSKDISVRLRAAGGELD